jgi:hypothetical protein
MRRLSGVVWVLRSGGGGGMKLFLARRRSQQSSCIVVPRGCKSGVMPCFGSGVKRRVARGSLSGKKRGD